MNLVHVILSMYSVISFLQGGGVSLKNKSSPAPRLMSARELE